MSKKKKNPCVFLDVSIDGDVFERMVFELFSDLVPNTAENFRALCTGEKGFSSKTGKPLHYKGTFFHRILKGSMAMGGDLNKCDGSYGESIFGENFPDELPKLKHDETGLLSMAIADRDKRGSLFNITFSANHHLDRKYVVFGKLIHGLEVLKKIENVGTDEEGRPTTTVKIIRCGESENELQTSDKRTLTTLKNGKDASSEANQREARHKRKHKKSSKSRRKRKRKHYSSDSDSSSDSEMETSESESESESDISSSSSSSSSSDISSGEDRRKKRKGYSKKDRYKLVKRRAKRRDRRHKKRDKRSKHRSKRASNSLAECEIEGKSGSSLKDANGDVHKLDSVHKNSTLIIVENQSSSFKEKEVGSFHHELLNAPDTFSEEGEFLKENREQQSNRVELEKRSEKAAERQPDKVDHPRKSRSRSISPRRSMSKGTSLSPNRSLSKSQSVSPKRNISRSPSIGVRHSELSRRSRSITRSPVRSGSSRSAAKSISRSPVRPKEERSISPRLVRARPRRSITRSPTSPLQKSPSRSPRRTSSRKSSRKSASISPVRSSRRSISRSPVRSSLRRISRSSGGRSPSRKSVSCSPVRASVRNNRRSFSRSPVRARYRERSPYADRLRSASRSLSPDGSSKRIRRGRGFSQRYSYARRYHSPERSPVRSYRHDRSDCDRYSSYRRSPRRHRTPVRDRTPPRYRSRRSGTLSRSVSRSPVHRTRRYSRGPLRSKSPIETSRYRGSPRVVRQRSLSRSRSQSESRSSASKSPVRANKEKSILSSESPPGKKGLVSYGDGSPDSIQR